MKRCIVIVCGLVFAQNGFAQSAVEKAEKRIAELVAPGFSIGGTSQPMPRKPGRAVESFEAPALPVAAAPVRLQPGALKAARLGSVPEAAPLVSFRDESQGPKQVELPTKPLIKLPSVDVNTPLPLPILARPLADRASLGDPAFDASLMAAMKRMTPTREKATPFVPYNLPDPFEHVRYGQLRNPPEESATPPVIRIDRPTK